jgi:hypothetical protein
MNELKHSENAASAHHGRFAAFVAFCMAVVVLGSTGYGIGRYWSAVGFSVFALFSVVGHVCIIAILRRTRARRAESETRPVQRWVRISTAICVIVAVAVIPVCLLPVILVETQGWPRLKSSDEESVSPGEKVTLTLNGSTVAPRTCSVSLASAIVMNTDELGDLAEPRFVLAGHFANQHNDLRDPGTYQVQVEIPNDPKWAGKTVRARLTLMLEDVDKQGTGGTIPDAVLLEIPVAPPGARATDQESWWIALFGGALPAVLVGLVLGGLAGTPRPKHSALSSSSVSMSRW